MTPDIQAALNKFLADLLTGTEKYAQQGIAFASEQIPLVLREKLYFDFSVAVMFALLGIVLITVPWLIAKRWNKWAANTLPKDTYSGVDQFDIGAWSFVIRAAGGVAGTIVFMVNLYTMLNIYFAPRLYIINWLQGMAAQVHK